MRQPLDYSAFRLPLYDVGVPPSIARHRLNWPKWGSYSYLPETRWLHHVEHGGFALLHHPCAVNDDICQIHRFAADFNVTGLRDMGTPQLTVTHSNLRWLLTPYHQLRSAWAVVTDGKVFMSSCFDQAEAARLVRNTYGDGLEVNMTGNGVYDYFWNPPSTLCVQHARHFSGVISAADAGIKLWQTAVIMLGILMLVMERSSDGKSRPSQKYFI